MKIFFFPALLALLFACIEANHLGLGAAESYAILAGSAVTTTGGAVSGGTVGVFPGTAITHTGTVITKDSAHAAQAQADLAATYAAVQAMTGATVLTGVLGGTLAPGLYKFAAAAALGDLTLDAGGDANAMWIFQIGAAMVFGPGSSVAVINGGSAQHVFWQVGAAATATGATVVGNVMAYAAITATGSSVEGRLLAVTAAVTITTTTVTANAPVPVPAPVPAPVPNAIAAPLDMGAAADYAVLAGAAITTTGGDISGDVGVSPGTAITKTGTTITGSLNSATAAAAAAKVALTAAYTEAQGKTADQDLSGQGLGGLTLTQGVYSFAAAATVDGVLTLQGDATAVWIFQIGSTVLFAPSSSIVMSGGGNPDRVYWQVGSSATATGATVVGNVMALASITATGTTVEGRLLARNAAVTLTTTTVTANVPVPVPAPVPNAIAAPLDMGAIGDFTVLAGSAITTTGGDISGDVGVSPGTAITKAGTTITGSLNSATAAAAAAKVALTAAYTEAQGKTADQDLSGQGLGGLTLTQGVYSFAAAATVDGVLTLQGDATAVWIFQIGSTVLFAPGSSIVMSGGGNPDRVYWQVGSSATATGATVVGNVMAYAAITATGSTVQGRLLARTAAVTLLSNTINLPYVPTAAPTFAPSLLPSFPPTHAPSFLPTWVSMAPTQSPTFAPSAPTVVPTSSPPSTSPTYVPTSSPTVGICGINRAGTLPVGNVADAEGWETGPNGKQYCFSYTGYTLLRHPFADCEAHCAGLEASMICLMDKAEADYVIAHQASTEFVWLYANAVPEGEGSEGSSWMEGCASTYVGDWYAPRYEYTPSNIATVVVMGTPLFADYAGKIMTIDPRQNGIAGCGCEKAAPQTRHLRSG